jgi:hypothetical protein
MGCHSHKKNSKGFELCNIGNDGVDKKENCITCHMPKIEGSATTIRKSKTHSFHGFAGIWNNKEMLSKYIDLKIKKDKKSFFVTIKNRSPHELLTHPLRVVELRVMINGKPYKREIFKKVLGNGSKEAPPYMATRFLKDSMIKANQEREIRFDKELKRGDEVVAELGYYIVDRKIVKKLGVKGDKKLESFHTLKRTLFKAK